MQMRFLRMARHPTLFASLAADDLGRCRYGVLPYRSGTFNTEGAATGEVNVTVPPPSLASV